MRPSKAGFAFAVVLGLCGSSSIGCGPAEAPPQPENATSTATESAAATPATAGPSGPATAAPTAEATASATAAASAAPAATTEPAAAGPSGPANVVNTYLELGAAGDLSKIKDLVDAKCQSTKIGQADAVKVKGKTLTLSDTETTVESESGDTATVKYTVKGSTDGKATTTQSGTLTVKKIDGKWVVSC